MNKHKHYPLNTREQAERLVLPNWYFYLGLRLAYDH